MPCPPIGWSPEGTFTRDPRVVRVLLVVPSWRDCGTCWGQRVILVPVEGVMARVECPRCEGSGQVLG